MSEPIFHRDELYKLLREALFKYSRLKRSVEIEIFAVEMEVPPGRADSADPALLDEFKKVVPDKVTLRNALSFAADYVERELVGLRHIEDAQVIVEDLRAAASNSEAMSNILKQVFGGEGRY